MSKGIVIVVIAAAAVFGGVWYFSGRSADQSDEAQRAASVAPAHAAAQPGDGQSAEAPASPAAVGPMDAQGRPVPTDPRLAALMVTPENALIEYVKGAD